MKDAIKREIEILKKAMQPKEYDVRAEKINMLLKAHAEIEKQLTPEQIAETFEELQQDILSDNGYKLVRAYIKANNTNTEESIH